MKCTCFNCKYRIEHPEGIICEKNLAFTNPEATCIEWDNDELFNPTKLVVLAIVVIGIALLCAKFL